MNLGFFMAFALGFMTRWAVSQVWSNVKRKIRRDK